jgi:hypothetical protein
MAELNFGLLTPPGSQSIGNAFVSGMDQAAVSRARENQNALSQYTLGKARREDELSNQLLGDLRNATTPEEIYRAYQRVGKPDVALKMQTDALTQEELRNKIRAQPGLIARTAAQTGAANAASARSRQQFEGQALRDLGVNPSDDNIRAWGQDAVIKEIYPQEEADQKVAQLLAIPLADRAANFSQYGAPAAAPEKAPAPPSMVAEYTFAKTPDGGNFRGSYQDFVTARAAARQPQRNTVASPGQIIYGPNGEIIATTPDKVATPPSMVAEYTFAKTPDGGNFRGSYQDFVTARAAAGRAPNTTHTNVQPDGQGGHVGLNTKTGRMEQIPQDADVVAGGVLSGDALELAAQGYLMNGKFPTNLGRGKQGAMNTIRIMERAAALANESGMPAEETAINQIAGKAKSVALTQIVKDLAAIRPYNAMLEKNGDIAISLAEKAISTNAQLANRPINWLKQNASDNPDVAEFLAQARIVTTEAARVLNNPRLVGQLTDSARREMEAILNGDMPLESFTRVVRRLQSDGKNRVDAMVAERDSLKQSIRRPNAAGQAAPAGAGRPSLDDIFNKKKP